MKRLFFIAMLFAVSFTAQAETINEAMEVLKYVESEHNPAALGDFRGDTPTAFGILQIRKIAIDDVNRVYGTNYSHQDAFYEDCAEEIFQLYTDYWANKVCERSGRDATINDIVRIWNGGPTGYLQNCTENYLEKYLDYKNKLYICKDEEKSEMYNQWQVSNYNKTLYSHGRYLYLSV